MAKAGIAGGGIMDNDLVARGGIAGSGIMDIPGDFGLMFKGT